MRLGISVRKKDDILYVKERYLEYFKNFDVIFLNMYNIERACDAYAIIGGDDADPRLYGETNVACKNISNYNDELDLKIIEIAIKNNKPLLGICRGLQMINIYFEGSLKQDIIGHSYEEHKIFLVKEDFHFKDVEIVNSFHHQSIKNLGKNLEVLYTAYDGEIECIIHKNYPIIAVQFHPEMDLNSDISRRIVMYFCKMVEKNNPIL